jgi:hypothetical protein
MNLIKRTINALIQRSGRFQQSENSNLKYQVNYQPILGASGTISTSTWTTESGSLTLTNEASADGITSVLVTGSIGEHRLVNKIVTGDGETYERIFRIKITDNDGDLPTTDYWWPRW